jgi:polyisoprenoid-binding protein YceI
MKRLLLSALLAVSAAPAFAADYVQAPGSVLVFASSYDGETFTGKFGGFATTLSFDPAKPDAARLDVTIALAGTSSGNGDRDSTLAGADFFDVARFAQARYTATKFRSLGGNRYAADGNLTLRGVTRPVTLTFTWTPGTQPVLAGKATVKRLDFGVGGGDWADTRAIPDEVAVSTRVIFKAK